ncbi:hypothetical protein MAR_002908 [Mya arenaria]|uniref:Uncharacterized protein n=1 Tax=Mya arenaria TaxID=6604 RepID=A0ABY7G5A6_MYAAR|nr:hypothetical protein MAR_002908 [Mya arenaria]
MNIFLLTGMKMTLNDLKKLF